MWAKLKAVPLYVKIVLGCLIALFVYGGMHQPPTPRPHTDVQASYGRNGGAPENDGDSRNQILQQYETQYAQVMAALNQCAAEMQQTTNQMQGAAMNGQMPMNAQPACMQAYPRQLSQAAFLEAQITRLRTGDTPSLREITGIQADSMGGTPSYDHPSTSGNDDAGDAVDHWDRGAIRGTSLYIDENGRQVELPTARYYFHNRETGQYVPSDSPTPPNDGSDYAPVTPNN